MKQLGSWGSSQLELLGVPKANAQGRSPSSLSLAGGRAQPFLKDPKLSHEFSKQRLQESVESKTFKNILP